VRALLGLRKRWLELHPSDRASTSLGWGPDAEGQHGFWERPNIVGFLMRNGAPPETGPDITTHHIRNWLAHDRDPAPTPHIDPRGYGAWSIGGRR
jgi:hypothetical protein